MTTKEKKCTHCGCEDHGSEPCTGMWNGKQKCYCGHEGHWTVPYLKGEKKTTDIGDGIRILEDFEGERF